MRAVSILPRHPGSLRLDNIAEPPSGGLLVRALAVGVCGTDRELIEGVYGEAPKGDERLILGHESLGRVISAPAGSPFAKDDLVVGIVRHPDPVPCAHCAVGEWDMCSNGLYTERGIKGAHGFASEIFALDSSSRAVKVDPSLGLCAVLLEPTTVIAKAWEHIEAIGRRARWEPKRALVTGAGPVGLMAALMGRQRGLEVEVLDHNDAGPKPKLVADLGCRYLTSLRALGDYDIVLECTGAPVVIQRVLAEGQPDGIVCLAGLSAGASEVSLPLAPFNQSVVLGNRVVFGSVNANLRHYQAAARALAAADKSWLERVITRRVPLSRYEDAYRGREDDVKTVLSFAD